MTELRLTLTPRDAASELKILEAASTRLGIDANRIESVKVTRRAIDARQRQVKVDMTVRLWLRGEPREADAVPSPEQTWQPLPADAPQAVVVGLGPAGLFAALRLVREGVRPVVLERGKDVDSRRADVARLARTGQVDPDSNYCFGEGGAGTFSDGKLYTRSKKRGPVDEVLRTLHAHGADADILVDAHPHIGSDRLPGIISTMRRTIERCGGEVHFGARVDELIMGADGAVVGVVTADGSRYLGPVILATGHSARDVYRTLARQGVPLEPKGLAVGVRLEHPQQAIDRLRYHSPEGRGKWLPPAEYAMVEQVDGRGVYSFCMCPGGAVIPAASEPGEIVVNGMSSSGRTSPLANSGMVVEVRPEDVPEAYAGPLRMLDWQADIERAFYEETRRAGCDNPLNAPAQRMTDFTAGRQSTTLPRSSYPPGVHSARVDRLLPEGVATRLQRGFEAMGRKHRGFLTPDALVVGCETRTSAPVRIPRDPVTMAHPAVPGLYPAGEGAGMAGGIVSAALDGDKAAAAAANQLHTRPNA